MQLSFSFVSSIARLCLCACLLVTLPAHAKRLALVMGNDNYASVTKLQKAGNDATAMARELKAAGFTVQLHKDLNYRGMVKAVESFTNSITGGDEVVVFYAGHGVQIKNGSYLLPTDIEASSEKEVEKTAYELLALTDMISEAKPAFSLVMVDACRDNPLKASGRSVGNARGLSAVEPPKGQMVVYSASRGQQALDRLNDSDGNPNSVFTREFIKKMAKPGVKIEDILRDVQDSVESLAKTVNHDQRPAIYNEARGNFYFFKPVIVQTPPAISTDPSPLELALWDSAKTATTAAEVQAYLNRYPAGFFAEMASARMAALTRANEPRIVAVGAPKPEIEKPVESQRKEVINNPLAQVVPSPPLPLKAGSVFKDCDICPEMVVIPGGAFQMGSKATGFLGQTKPASFETPQHDVSIKQFAMGKYEVTQEQWNSIMGTMPSRFTGAKLPVEQVSWSDANAYVKKLSEKTGRSYRLPTEAEWEFAARAGNKAAYSFDNFEELEKFAWFNTTGFSLYGKSTKPVGEKLPNGFGLYDVHGNVFEWTQDCWNINYEGAPFDGSAWTTGDCSRRVIRGGSWLNTRDGLRSASRDRGVIDARQDHYGFRVALTP